MNNKKINKLSSGFTLLEVLIATVIFATVMVITTGVVGSSIRYQTKLTAVRKVNVETAKIADSLSRDIRSANTSGTYKYLNTTGGYVTNTFSSGVVILRCISANNCTPYSNKGAAITNSVPNGYAIIIFTKQDQNIKSKVYFNKLSDKKLYYLETNSDTITSGEIWGMTKVIAGETVDGETSLIELVLGGYAPDDASIATNLLSQQPFVTFEIKSTINGLTPAEFASTTIKSSISLRHYSR